MACFSKFVCTRCGFEILTEPHFYYRLMSGYQVTRKCSECKSIVREHLDMFEIPHFDSLRPFLQWIESEDFRIKHGFCPECHQRARLTLWSPVSNRCPRCRHMLTLKQKGIMMVDWYKSLLTSGPPDRPQIDVLPADGAIPRRTPQTSNTGRFCPRLSNWNQPLFAKRGSLQTDLPGKKTLLQHIFKSIQALYGFLNLGNSSDLCDGHPRMAGYPCEYKCGRRPM